MRIAISSTPDNQQAVFDLAGWIIGRGHRIETVFRPDTKPPENIDLVIYVGPLLFSQWAQLDPGKLSTVGLWSGAGAGEPTDRALQTTEKWFAGRLELQRHIESLETPGSSILDR
jgi:hypothetical protein